jgi:hypothetical protein
MPLWLWQEVQALPWSTEIVALTCGTQNCLRPPSSLLKRPRQACCATPVQDQKCWNTAAFEQSQFFDHTGNRLTPEQIQAIAHSEAYKDRLLAFNERLA